MKLNRSPGFRVILEQVRLARQQYGEHLKPAADDADIDRLRHDCASIYGLRVPDGYCDFLRLSDGLTGMAHTSLAQGAFLVLMILH